MATDTEITAAASVLFCHAQWHGDDWTTKRVANEMLQAAAKAERPGEQVSRSDSEKPR